MKKYIYAKESNISAGLESIRVVMYLRPEIYLNSAVVTSSVKWDNDKKKYYTDVNPDRRINGPLSDYGQELESPIKEEYNAFIEDCIWLIEECGFKIIKRTTSTDSKKSEYVTVFGMNDNPCGSLIFELRLSDHPLDVSFPEDLKDEVLEYLKMENILNDSASKAGINFRVEKVTVGSVANDSWERAFDRLYIKLKQMRKKVRTRLKSESER